MSNLGLLIPDTLHVWTPESSPKYVIDEGVGFGLCGVLTRHVLIMCSRTLACSSFRCHSPTSCDWQIYHDLLILQYTFGLVEAGSICSSPACALFGFKYLEFPQRSSVHFFC